MQLIIIKSEKNLKASFLQILIYKLFYKIVYKMVKKFNIKNGWAEVDELTHDFLVPVPDVSIIRCLLVEFV